MYLNFSSILTPFKIYGSKPTDFEIHNYIKLICQKELMMFHGLAMELICPSVSS